MHWARWGDPAAEAPLPEAARGLVELAFGPAEEHPTVPLAGVRVPESALGEDLLDGLRGLVGADHVHTDHETRVRHTRGKSTTDLLRMRAGDGSDAPDVVVRPADHDQVAALVAWCRSAAVRRSSAGSPPCATGSSGSSRWIWPGSTGCSRSTRSPGQPCSRPASSAHAPRSCSPSTG